MGTIFSTNADPTVGGTRQMGSIDAEGNVTATLANLTEGTTYYYATYVTLQGKVTKYGEVKSFMATDADVATAAATNVTACKATFNGQASGVDEIVATTHVGFKYALEASAVQEGIEVAIAEPSTTFSSTVKGLIPGKTYYYAAYTKVVDGYIYGNTQQFTTTQQTMEYVDLGLSTTWAKYNIGAEAEDESWGKQVFFWGKENHVSGTYAAYNGDDSIEEAFVKQEMNKMMKKFVDKGYPVILGEYGAIWRTLKNSTPAITNNAYQTKHDNSIKLFHHVVNEYAINHGIIPFVWETNGKGQNSMDVLDRATLGVFNKHALEGIKNGVAAAQWGKETTGFVEVVSETSFATHRVYNLAGQRVTDATKGILITDGKKFLKH